MAKRRKPLTVRMAKRRGMLFDVVSQVHGMRKLGRIIADPSPIEGFGGPERAPFKRGLRLSIIRTPLTRLGDFIQVWK